MIELSFNSYGIELFACLIWFSSSSSSALSLSLSLSGLFVNAWYPVICELLFISLDLYVPGHLQYLAVPWIITVCMSQVIISVNLVGRN